MTVPEMGRKQTVPTANTNTALSLRVWESPVAKCLPAFALRGPSSEQVRKIMAFIKQTLWLSLRMAKVSLTAGNCNTCGLLKRGREYVHGLGKKVPTRDFVYWGD